MNEKIWGWLAIAVILLSVGWAARFGLLQHRHAKWAVVGLLGLALVCRHLSLRSARRTVLARRRFYKALWKRADADDVMLTKAEEELIVLLGRIKGARPTTALMSAVCLLAIIFGANTLALILALGLLYLATALFLITRRLGRAVPDDSTRAAPHMTTPIDPSGTYLVSLDIRRVHDFIKPPAALPFWRIPDVLTWLARHGFQRTDANTWLASGSALSYLESEEIIALKPAYHTHTGPQGHAMQC